jgi:hypothetical protein
MDYVPFQIERLPNGWYRVCSPSGAMCIDSFCELRAHSIGETLHTYCSTHSEMRASRASVQNS